MHKRGLSRNISAFTLWEVLLVLVLLGTVTFLVVPKYTVTLQHVKSETNDANLLKIERAVRLYTLDIGKCPDSIENLMEKPIDKQGWRGPYLDDIPDYPLDPELDYALGQGGKVIIR